MVANNEIGTIQPIHQIAAIARKHDVVLHFDAAQAVGKVPLYMDQLDCDLVSFSGHKMYGPKGVGGLYFRKAARSNLHIEPQIHGGGQEYGLRSGTQAVHLIVGLGTACAIAHEEFERENARISQLRNSLEAKLRTAIPEIVVNGHPTERLCGNLHVSIPELDGELLPVMLQKVCCSARSACSSESQTVSYVLTAVGMDEKLARASLRFGVGRFNTAEEIDEAAQLVIEAVKRTRRFSVAEAAHTA
jgi:cysteine desulfurase